LIDSFLILFLIFFVSISFPNILFHLIFYSINCPHSFYCQFFFLSILKLILFSNLVPDYFLWFSFYTRIGPMTRAIDFEDYLDLTPVFFFFLAIVKLFFMGLSRSYIPGCGIMELTWVYSSFFFSIFF